MYSLLRIFPIMMKKEREVMSEIIENGYVKWKGLLVTIGGFIFAIFLYLDSKIVTKDQFNEFKEHVMITLADIKNEVRKKD